MEKRIEGNSEEGQKKKRKEGKKERRSF